MSEESEESERERSFDDLNSLIKTLSALDERGLIVSLGSFAEEALGVLITAFLRPNASTRYLTTGFNAPFGSFSTRIKGCHALGLITDEQFSDLEHLRKIRNAYSHTWKSLSFTDQAIGAHVAALSFPASGDEFPETPREKVTQSLSFLLVELSIQADQIAKNGQRANLIGRRLFAGLSGSPAEQREKLAESLAAISRDLPSATGEKLRYLEAGKRHCAMLQHSLQGQ